MGDYFPCITDAQADLIRNAKVFFVATADPEMTEGPDGQGPINLSPKGGVPIHILDSNRVAYLDYKGSGNETVRHSQSGSPITLMVCSFDSGDAAIVRLYGRAASTPVDDSPVASQLLECPAEGLHSKPRQVVEIVVEKTSTSCGYGVPVMDYVLDRDAARRGRRYKEAPGD